MQRAAGQDQHAISDRDRFPVWREWAAEAGQVPSRAIAVERLKLLGVLKDPENDWSC